jgi:hypothetical protein
VLSIAAIVFLMDFSIGPIFKYSIIRIKRKIKMILIIINLINQLTSKKNSA